MFTRRRQTEALFPGALLVIVSVASPALAQLSAGSPGEDLFLGAHPFAYQLTDSPLRTQPPGAQLRLEATTSIAPRHELRFSTWTAGRTGFDSLAGASSATLSSALSAEPGLRLDPARATYRYTFLAQRDWAWKLGVSSNLRELGETVRPGLTTSDRFRFGTLPLLHFAGEGRLAPRWRLAFDADGLMTPRGRTFDLGLRVNYSLTRNVLLYGGYRLTDSGGDAEEFYGAGLSNAANVGLRYRF
jgi:hypothetical protein